MLGFREAMLHQLCAQLGDQIDPLIVVYFRNFLRRHTLAGHVLDKVFVVSRPKIE